MCVRIGRDVTTSGGKVEGAEGRSEGCCGEGSDIDGGGDAEGGCGEGGGGGEVGGEVGGSEGDGLAAREAATREAAEAAGTAAVKGAVAAATTRCRGGRRRTKRRGGEGGEGLRFQLALGLQWRWRERWRRRLQWRRRMAALRGRRGRLRWGQVQQGPHTSSSSSEESGACEGTRGVSAPRAISARCLRTHIKRTLTSSLTKRFTRGLLVLFRTLGKIQIHSFKSHLKRCTGSRAVPKTWCAEQQLRMLF